MKFHIRVEQDNHLELQNLFIQSLTFFEKKYYSIKINFPMQVIELLTLHLMMYGVF